LVHRGGDRDIGPRGALTVYIIAPLIGACVGWGVWRALAARFPGR